MRERVVVVLGAGNLRCGPHLLAGLANWAPDDVVDIRLWDSNEERLDLFDRFLRECLDKAGTEHHVRSSSDYREELQGATDVVFSVHEDCARRLLGQRSPELYAPEAPASLVDQVRGDPNRPTPPENLSMQTKVILSTPIDEGEGREAAITRALEVLLADTPQSSRVLSMQRGVPLPTTRTHTVLDWPPAIPSLQLAVVPHQVLRWIHGEESLGSFLRESAESPVSQWLAE